MVLSTSVLQVESSGELFVVSGYLFTIVVVVVRVVFVSLLDNNINFLTTIFIEVRPLKLKVLCWNWHFSGHQSKNTQRLSHMFHSLHFAGFLMSTKMPGFGGMPLFHWE